MNTAFLLITTAWLAGAGTGLDYGWDDCSYASYWSGYESDSYSDGSFLTPCGYNGGGCAGGCCGAPCCPDTGGDWCGEPCCPTPCYVWCCQPCCPKKECCLKRLCHHFHHKEPCCPPCGDPCYNPCCEPCFQDYYATSCCAASGCCDTEKHCCLSHLLKHCHHHKDCGPPPCGPTCWQPYCSPCWQPCCPPCGFCEEPCEISFHKGHCHKPHCCCHQHHHKHHQPAPCCALCCVPCVECCPVCSDGCCGACDDCCGCEDGCCGAEYGGPAYGVTPKAAPAPKPAPSPPAAKPEKIGGPKSSKD